MRVNHLITIFFLFSLMSCSSKSSFDKNTITVSILPQKKIAEELLDSTIKVNVMVVKGSSPATYSPTPQQMRLISESSLYIKIGQIGFEKSWMDRFEEMNPKMKVKDSSKGVEFIGSACNHQSHDHSHSHDHGVDPHTWTSPKTMYKIIQNTKEILLEHFPEKEELIKTNSQKLLAELEQLDNLYQTKLSDFKNKSFLIFHPAYTYLADDYGLKQISIENEGKEPGVQWIAETIAQAKKDNIKAIFIQEEFDQKSAELIAKELNIPIIKVHPLSEEFTLEMEELLKKLTKVLN